MGTLRHNSLIIRLLSTHRISLHESRDTQIKRVRGRPLTHSLVFTVGFDLAWPPTPTCPSFGIK